MKLFNSIILLAAITLLNNACVSRTSTSEKVYGNAATEKKTIWIWQDEYRNTK
jgi:hypothetical protein